MTKLLDEYAVAALEQIQFYRDAADTPDMICAKCGTRLCSVDDGDTLAVLVSVAADHDCGPCDACGAEPGECCRPMCIGEAAHQDALGIDLTEEQP